MATQSFGSGRNVLLFDLSVASRKIVMKNQPRTLPASPSALLIRLLIKLTVLEALHSLLLQILDLK